jgi:Cu/Ag efflux protein CusF
VNDVVVSQVVIESLFTSPRGLQYRQQTRRTVVINPLWFLQLYLYKDFSMSFSTRRPALVLAVSLSTLLLACSKADDPAVTAPAAQTPSTAEVTPEAMPIQAMPTEAIPTEISSEETETYEEGVPGGVRQRITTLTASVKTIDYAARTLTIDNANGEEMTITAAPQAVNFQQIKAGDQVNIEYVEQVIISLKEADGMPGENSAEMSVTRAPEGNKPAVEIEASQITTATVTAINAEARTATLQFADGSSREVNVRPDIELKPEQIGREVVFETSQYLMLNVEKAPQQ